MIHRRTSCWWAIKPERCNAPRWRFSDLADLNRQLLLWCDKVNHAYKPRLRAKPIELYQAEKPLLKPLPIYFPEVYALHQRIVDLEGYVTLHTNRYSAPTELIGRRVQVRESKDRVRIFDDHRVAAEHNRREEGTQARETLAEHQHRGLWRNHNKYKLPPLPEEEVLNAASPTLKAFVQALKGKYQNRATSRIRNLYRMFLDYPTQVLDNTLAEALEYGLLDLKRIEHMVLRNIAGEFFRLSSSNNDPQGDENE